MVNFDRKQIISWSLYDWANSAFATSVMAGFFPVFFKHYWSSGSDPTVSTFQLGLANSFASLAIALVAPLLGAIADRGGARKKFLFFFAVIGVVMTASLALVAQGNWEIALIIYLIAIIGFSGGNIFYDALIVEVASEKKLDVVSALGYAFGYFGGGVLFAFNVFMVSSYQTFGFTTAEEALHISFVTVALWWAVFSLPLFLWVKEQKPENNVPTIRIVAAGLHQFYETFREIRTLKVVFLFLLGYWLYIDGVDTVIRMALDYGMSIGLSSQSLIKALLITQFVGFPAALAFGKLGEKLGAKTGIFIGLAVYISVTIWGYRMQAEWEFYLLAVIVGLVQGGVQALSRSLYAKIIPKNKAAQFFGFYNMLGKFAAVIGPLLIGWVSIVSGNPRYSILSINVLFIGGAIILYFVNEAEGHNKARAME